MDMSCLVAGVEQVGGVRVRGAHAAAHDAMGHYLLAELGLPVDLWRESPGLEATTAYSLSREAFDGLMPRHDTLLLRRSLDPVSLPDDDRALDREIAVALLGGPLPQVFDSVQAFISQVRVQRHRGEWIRKLSMKPSQPALRSNGRTW